MTTPAALSQIKITLLKAACLLAIIPLFVLPAKAQVPGTFSPSVYGDTQVAPLPVRVEIPPGTPLVKARAIQLKEDIESAQRPYISSVVSYSNEPVSNFNNKLATITPGLEFGFSPNRRSQLKFNYLPTVFGLSQPRIGGQEWRLSYKNQPTDRFRYVSSLGLFNTFHNVRNGVALLGNSGFLYTLTDRIRVGAEYRRDIVGDSRLSATGLNLPASNELVGRVKRNRFSLGLSLRPTARTDIDFRYTLGFDAGHKITTNRFNEFSFRVGKSIIAKEPGAHLQLFQVSYQLLATGFRKDLSGFGNLSLTPSKDYYENQARLISSARGNTNLAPGINEKRAGVGGYFSPQIFYLNSIRLDTAGRLIGPLSYRMGGSIGTQDFKDTFNNLGHPTIVGTANVALIWQLNRHITIEPGWYFLQAANTYQRNVIYNNFRYTF
ncbi:MAG: hypothetical protein K2X27_17735 [Candidatus Obscuribacterales bacterium]|nr:hypothetical protein [Candidatus Obscuribacterales bacterium]